MQSSSSPTRNKDFYLEDIVFLVEGKLFKTYGYYFMQHSPMLKSKIEGARASSGDDALLGIDDEHPMPLDDVGLFEFERFLSTIYPSNPIQNPIDRLITDWENIPKLTKKLGMLSVPEKYIKTLEPMLSRMKSVDRVIVGRQFAVDDWFCTAIFELVTRDDTLIASEIHTLRVETALRILRLREEWIKLKARDLEANVLKNIVQFTFSPPYGRYMSATSPAPLPTIPAERFDQLRLAIQHCFRSELTEMGFPVDVWRRPILFQLCLDNDKNISLRSETADTKQSHRESPIHHSAHYFEAIIFRVDDEIFRVHKDYFFKHSPVFREMLQVGINSTRTCSQPDGRSDEQPLYLRGITKKSFGLFLLVIFPKDFLVNIELDYDGWEAVLELSTIWRMRSLRKYCIQCMSPLPNHVNCINKVLMGRKYMAEDWLVEGYQGLITRSELLTNQEIEQLGSSPSIELLRLSVKWLKGADRSNDKLLEDIQSTFWDEIKRLQEYDIDSEE